MVAPKQEKLEVTIKDIWEKKILLPDFQRKFIWTEEEMQRNLVASVLAKMPVGSILLLKSTNADEYSCKLLGARAPLNQNELPDGEVNFLLDGQQRMTVLTNVFSDVVFQSNKQVSNLVSPSALKRRFFLLLPKLDNNDEDLYGLKKLIFPMESANAEEPEFLTSDVLPYVKVISFNVSTDNCKSYYPYNTSSTRNTDLKDFCVGNDSNWYYIPLFLLVPVASAHRNISLLGDIIEEISKSTVDAHVTSFGDKISVMTKEEKEDYIRKNITSESYEYHFNDGIDEKTDNAILKQFKDALSEQAAYWKTQMKEYLSSCVNDISLGQIILEKSQRARAIDVYENLNRGGVSLDVFDLVCARVGQVSTESLSARVKRCIQTGSSYTNTNNIFASSVVASDFIKINTNNEYHASERLGCYDENNDNISGHYLNTFLNILSLLSYTPDLSREEYSLDLIKKPKKLALTAQQIDGNCELACKAIDRACFFLQSRCGIRKISEVNYVLMITVIAYVLSDDRCFSGTKNNQIFNLLEAWYWSSIFAGHYNSDQNQVMIQDLNHLVQNVLDILDNNNPDIAWVQNLKNDIFKIKGFSDKDMLLLKDVSNNGIPKTILSNAICQYYLSKGYVDLVKIGNDETMLTVFSDVADDLQMHHVIPLGSANTIGTSSKTLRNDKKHFLNSPLNYLYITANANTYISSKSLAEYAQLIPVGARLSNVGFATTNINSNSTENEREEALEQRFDAVNGNVQQHVGCLLYSLSI